MSDLNQICVNAKWHYFALRHSQFLQSNGNKEDLNLDLFARVGPGYGETKHRLSSISPNLDLHHFDVHRSTRYTTMTYRLNTTKG